MKKCNKMLLSHGRIHGTSNEFLKTFRKGEFWHALEYWEHLHLLALPTWCSFLERIWLNYSWRKNKCKWWRTRRWSKVSKYCLLCEDTPCLICLCSPLGKAPWLPFIKCTVHTELVTFGHWISAAEAGGTMGFVDAFQIIVLMTKSMKVQEESKSWELHL